MTTISEAQPAKGGTPQSVSGEDSSIVSPLKPDGYIVPPNVKIADDVLEGLKKILTPEQFADVMKKMLRNQAELDRGLAELRQQQADAKKITTQPTTLFSAPKQPYKNPYERQRPLPGEHF